MDIKIVHEIDLIKGFLKKKNPYDYLYQRNNMEPENWCQVVCFGLFEDQELLEIAMLNRNYGIPVLLAAAFENQKYSEELICGIKDFLPRKFYTHMDEKTLDTVFTDSIITDKEAYVNMGLTDRKKLREADTERAFRLDEKNLYEIQDLINESYPEAWLEEGLIRKRENFGIFEAGKLISFSGIHAYSEEQGVAAIAHVTTLPHHRNKGYGKAVTGALAKSLGEKIQYVGLNVREDNPSAISCYKKLGFSECGHFVACEIELKASEK